MMDLILFLILLFKCLLQLSEGQNNPRVMYHQIGQFLFILACEYSPKRMDTFNEIRLAWNSSIISGKSLFCSLLYLIRRILE